MSPGRWSSPWRCRRGDDHSRRDDDHLAAARGTLGVVIPETWIPHRRDDGELVGWIDMTVAEPRLVPIDRLGRALEPVDDWFEAEETLDGIGLRFLAERFVYPEAGEGAGAEVVTVRIAHLYDDRIVLTTALTDAIEDVGREIVVPFPAPAELRSP